MHMTVMKRKLLILDDDLDRFTFFTRVLGKDYDSIYTAESLLEMAERGEVVAETLMLDHDLGSNMDGTGLARALRDGKIPLPSVKRILIHSNNITRNREMAYTLQEAYPDISIKLLPTSQITDLWTESQHDQKTIRDFIESL